MLPPESAPSRFGHALARRLWITLALALVVTAGAVVVYAQPAASWRHAYVATQPLRIIVAPAAAPTTYDAYVAHQEADGLARVIAGGSIFSSPSFDAAVERLLATQHAGLVARYGSGVPANISSTELAGALSASDTGDVVTLASRWSGAPGANALLSSAVAVLTHANDLRTFVPGNAAAQAPDAALAQPVDSLTATHLDSTAEAAARRALLTRIALGILVGLAVAILLAAFALRDPAVPLPETAAASDTTLAGQR